MASSKKILFSLIYLGPILIMFFLTAEAVCRLPDWLGIGKTAYKDYQKKIDVINGAVLGHSIDRDRHSLVKTLPTSERDKGTVLLVGNSVAAGHGKFNDYSSRLGSKIESYTRDRCQLGLINLSHSGNTSWNEFVEISRYLNTYNDFIDLPHPTQIVSFGGIQDFWLLIDKLDPAADQSMLPYKAANGLMIDIKIFNYLHSAPYLDRGNVGLALRGVLDSSLNFLLEKSYLVKNARSLRIKLIQALRSNSSSISIPDRNSLDVNSSLKSVLQSEAGIGYPEYRLKRDKVVDSVVRNSIASRSISPGGNYAYVYAPSRLSMLDKHIDAGDVYPFGFSPDFYYHVEKDYREALIKKLSSVGVKNYDMHSVGDPEDWFYDFSHFSSKGTNKIAPIIGSLICKN